MSNFKKAELTNEIAHRLVSMPGAALMGAGGNVLLRDSEHQSPQELTGAAIGGALGDEVSDRLLNHYLPHLLDLANKNRAGLLASTGLTGLTAAGLPLLGGYLGSRVGELFKQEQPLDAQGNKTASIEYHGHTFPGYNKPIANKGGGKHKKVVLAKKGDKVKMIGFGHRDYQHNYSAKAKANYLKRSAGIKNKSGELTKNDKLSANYWARRVLWPSGPATGAAKKTAHITGVEVEGLGKYMDFRKTAAAAGTMQALTQLGLKLANVFPTGAMRGVLRDVGSHALGGAATGALGGAVGAESGHRMEGALRGGAIGGALGGTIGAANLGIMKARGARISDVDAERRLFDDAVRQRPETADFAEDYQNIRNIFDKKYDPANPLRSFHAQNATARMANPVLTGAAGMASQWGLGRDDNQRQMRTASSKLAAFPTGELGAALRAAGHGAAIGTMGGALGGAYSAGEGHRMEGALKGGLTGGAIGGLAGGAHGYLSSGAGNMARPAASVAPEIPVGTPPVSGAGGAAHIPAQDVNLEGVLEGVRKFVPDAAQAAAHDLTGTALDTARTKLEPHLQRLSPEYQNSLQNLLDASQGTAQDYLSGLANRRASERMPDLLRQLSGNPEAQRAFESAYGNISNVYGDNSRVIDALNSMQAYGRG